VERAKVSFRFGLVFEEFSRPSAYLGAHGIRVFAEFRQSGLSKAFEAVLL
jgi:hypothetical protein